MEDAKEAEGRFDGAAVEAVDEGEEERGDGVWGVREEELFGEAEGGGSNGGAGGGDGVL